MGSLLQDIEFLNLNDVSEDESTFIQALLTTSTCDTQFPWDQNTTRSRDVVKPLLPSTGVERPRQASAVQFPWDQPASKTKYGNESKSTLLGTGMQSQDHGFAFPVTSSQPPAFTPAPTTIVTSLASVPSVHSYAPPPPCSTAHPSSQFYYISQHFPYGGPSIMSPMTPNVYVNNMTANVNVHHGMHHVPYTAQPGPPPASMPRPYSPEKNDKMSPNAPAGQRRGMPSVSPTKRGPPPGTKDPYHMSSGAVSMPAGYSMPPYGGVAASLSFQGTPGTASYVTGQHFYQHTAQTATGAPFVIQQPYFYMPVYPTPHANTHHQAVNPYPEPMTSLDHQAARILPVNAASPGILMPPYDAPDHRVEVSFGTVVGEGVEEYLEQVGITSDEISPSKYIAPNPATEAPILVENEPELLETDPIPKEIEVTQPPPVIETVIKPIIELEAITPVPTASPVPSGGAGRSWASLFKSGVASSPTVPPNTQSSIPYAVAPPPEKPLARVEPFVANSSHKSISAPLEAIKPAGSGEDEAFARQLGAQLADNALNHAPVSLMPRGLTNKGNWCYINATLQALLACPAFVNLMRSLSPVMAMRTSESTTPIIDSMVDFAAQFETLPPALAISGKAAKKERANGANKKEEVPCGANLEPGAVHRMLSCIRSETFKVEGRQEDAEEFLSCLLNGLHDEMSEVIKLAQKETTVAAAAPPKVATPTEGHVGTVAQAQQAIAQDDDEWKLIGPKNKGMVTRSASFSRTPISDLFLGQMRSAVTHSGGSPTATLQPFFSLQLDIQNERVTSVQQALEALVAREALQGFTCSRTGAEVEATRQTTLEELPPVLLLHLKCFVYDQTAQAQGGAGIQKLIKRIDFSVDLELNKDFLSPSVRAKVKDRHRQYKLFAVVYHDGKEATKGHYVSDVHHPGLGAWLRFDDSSVKPLCDANLHKYNPPRMPYLLFYRRPDPTK